jgi:hypothetical protein
MRQGVSSVGRETYATAIADLWSGLARTLTRLEQFAAEPEGLLDEDEAIEVLPRLQYSLHSASELTAGIEPPSGAETPHAELAAALADARDATADVLDALEDGGPEAAFPLLHEWRGALFRVRLARLRLVARQTASASITRTRPREGLARNALASTLLALVGVSVVAAGASYALWPVWAAGLLLLGLGIVVYRP